MASRFYGNGIKGLATGLIIPGTDTLKAAIVTASYTPDFDAHDFFDDITNEVTGTGYSAGGVTLTSVTVAIDSTNHRVYIDFDDPSWASSTITNGRALIIYKSTGTAATSRLLMYIDLGGNKSTTGDTFYVQIPAPASDAAAYFSY